MQNTVMLQISDDLYAMLLRKVALRSETILRKLAKFDLSFTWSVNILDSYEPKFNHPDNV
jgi:hypothetical protein